MDLLFCREWDQGEQEGGPERGSTKSLPCIFSFTLTHRGTEMSCNLSEMSQLYFTSPQESQWVGSRIRISDLSSNSKSRAAGLWTKQNIQTLYFRPTSPHYSLVGWIFLRVSSKDRLKPKKVYDLIGGTWVHLPGSPQKVRALAKVWCVESAWSPLLLFLSELPTPCTTSSGPSYWSSGSTDTWFPFSAPRLRLQSIYHHRLLPESAPA